MISADVLEDLKQPRADLAADGERLADIGDWVRSGVPIETFELGEYEIYVVVAYCQHGAFESAAGSCSEEEA